MVVNSGKWRPKAQLSNSASIEPPTIGGSVDTEISMGAITGI